MNSELIDRFKNRFNLIFLPNLKFEISNASHRQLTSCWNCNSTDPISLFNWSRTDGAPCWSPWKRRTPTSWSNCWMPVPISKRPIVWVFGSRIYRQSLRLETFTWKLLNQNWIKRLLLSQESWLSSISDSTFQVSFVSIWNFQNSNLIETKTFDIFLKIRT